MNTVNLTEDELKDLNEKTDLVGQIRSVQYIIKGVTSTIWELTGKNSDGTDAGIMKDNAHIRSFELEFDSGARRHVEFDDFYVGTKAIVEALEKNRDEANGKLRKLYDQLSGCDIEDIFHRAIYDHNCTCEISVRNDDFEMIVRESLGTVICVVQAKTVRQCRAQAWKYVSNYDWSKVKGC